MKIGQKSRNDMFHKSTGILEYHGERRLVVAVDEGLVKYYRSGIAKNISFNIPMYAPHITVVRGRYETPKDRSAWGAYEGEKIEFEYEHDIKSGPLYIWLSVQSKRIEEIREELGLDKCFDKFKGFHITIANMKGLK